MSLVLPSEIIVDRFLPTIRAMLATRLDEHGLTQQAIADHLGVTQAAVSNYLGATHPVENPFSTDTRTIATVDRIAAGLATGDMDGYEAISELLALIREFEDRGPICEVHEAEMPELRGLGCDLCVRGPDEAVHAERAALASVRKAARILTTIPGMAAFIPNVGTNVGTALPNATDPTDVAAIPGRIYTLGGRIEVPANPEFGASTHVATTILAATSVEPAVRGAINIATDVAFLDAARESGLTVVDFNAGYEDRQARLEGLFQDRGVPGVIYHEGAFGIEPITYVFGATAVEAANQIVELVAATSGEPSGETD